MLENLKFQLSQQTDSKKLLILSSSSIKFYIYIGDWNNFFVGVAVKFNPLNYFYKFFISISFTLI